MSRSFRASLKYKSSISILASERCQDRLEPQVREFYLNFLRSMARAALHLLSHFCCFWICRAGAGVLPNLGDPCHAIKVIVGLRAIISFFNWKGQKEEEEDRGISLYLYHSSSSKAQAPLNPIQAGRQCHCWANLQPKVDHLTHSRGGGGGYSLLVCAISRPDSASWSDFWIIITIINIIVIIATTRLRALCRPDFAPLLSDPAPLSDFWIWIFFFEPGLDLVGCRRTWFGLKKMLMSMLLLMCLGN